MAEAEQAAFDAHTVHDVECAFYEACGQIEDFPLPIVWFTRKIGGIEPGVILMEDFGQVECKLRHFRPLNVQQVSLSYFIVDFTAMSNTPIQKRCC